MSTIISQDIEEGIDFVPGKPLIYIPGFNENPNERMSPDLVAQVLIAENIKNLCPANVDAVFAQIGLEVVTDEIMASGSWANKNPSIEGSGYKTELGYTILPFGHNQGDYRQ